MKALKWILLAFGGLMLIVVVVVGFFVATFDPNSYKPQIVDWVKRATGRTLTMEGTIGLTLFPSVGATVGKVTLSEPESAAIFGRVAEARVGVALLPLLSRQVVVDRVTLHGLGIWSKGEAPSCSTSGRPARRSPRSRRRSPGPPTSRSRMA
jgi:AsmA protein